MRGEVLHYDEAQGFGFITGADGNRYTFTREDLRRDGTVSKGTVVEFQNAAGQAKGVFAIRAEAGRGAAAQGPTAAPAAPVGGPPPQAHFGRAASAVDAVPSTSLWGYFLRALTSNYVNFRERARRKEYWGFYLFWMLAAIGLALLGLMIDGSIGNLGSTSSYGPIASLTLPGLFVLATFLPALAITIRRQHDIGLSGWFYLLILIPYIGGMIIFVFSLIPSQKHENKWGPVPQGITIPPPYVAPTQA